MKKIVGLIFAGIFAFGMGFGTASKEKKVLLDAPDGKKYEFVIGTASENGSYYKAGLRLEKTLNNTRAFTTDGSWQNMELLNEGLINVAFVQGDVYNLWLSNHKSASEKLAVIKTNRTEYVQLIMRKDGDEDDLQSKDAKVFIGLPNSGGAGSWRNMTLLEPNYGEASAITGPLDIIALNDLADKKFDAIIRTCHISLDDEILKKVNSNKFIKFKDLDDKDLNDNIEINGKDEPVYNFSKVKIKDSFLGNSVRMLETHVYVVINTDLTTRKQRGQIIDKILLYGTGLFE